MTQWEYVAIQGSSDSVDRNPGEFVHRLNAAGWDGWELVSVIHYTHLAPAKQSVTAILKRPVTEERKRQLVSGT